MIFILISALLYSLAFPSVSLWPLSFVALVPLFYAIEQCEENSGSMKQLLARGFSWGLFAALGLGFWLFPSLLLRYEVSLVKTIIFMILCLFIPLGLLFLLFTAAYRFLFRNHILFYIFIVPSLWILFEYLRELIPVGIPWGFIGYTAVPFSPFIQAADFCGIYGISFLLVLCNSLIFYIFKNTDRSQLKSSITPVFLLLCVLALPSIYGLVRLSHFSYFDKSIKGKAVPVSIVQGNFGARERWIDNNFFSRLQTYLAMSAAKDVLPGKRIIVWPETVLNSPGKVTKDLFAHIINRVGPDSLLITGGVRKKKSGSGVYNSAFIISGSGSINFYDKNILLPFAESAPAGSLLDKYYNAPAEFARGRSSPFVSTPFGPAGLSICFESLYPWFSRVPVSKGALFLVNISNDAWFGNSPEPFVHLAGAAVRAIENRRFLIRASNSGISAVISPSGKIIQASKLFSRESIHSEIIPLNTRSFYSRFGDWILFGAVFFVMAGLAVSVFRD
ncbi:MAG: apolipoprotein N-acyltransferase [bacterium]|nr:apolipoprotein N-acyltransferase [bacterium]